MRIGTTARVVALAAAAVVGATAARSDGVTPAADKPPAVPAMLSASRASAMSRNWSSAVEPNRSSASPAWRIDEIICRMNTASNCFATLAMPFGSAAAGVAAASGATGSVTGRSGPP